MSENEEQLARGLLDYLPAIYHEAVSPGDQFLSGFLKAFEKILTGNDDLWPIPADEKTLHRFNGESYPLADLETTISHIADLFDPQSTWDEFLPWLASWTAFSLRADLPPQNQRDFLSEIFQLYRRRGTRDNLVRLLTIFTVGTPTIEDVPRDVPKYDPQAHFFRVTLRLMNQQIKDAKEIQRQIAIARALIDLEKPAYTYYELNAEHVTMQLGVSSTIGQDTLLGINPVPLKS
jgi:phage tail-like protein